MYKAPGSSRRRPRALVATLAVVVAVSAVMASVALARSFTLTVVKHAKITNQTGHVSHANAVADAKGFIVYTLTGDSKKHPECTKALCWQFWPPVTVKSKAALSKMTGVKGKLGTWKRGHILQVTIDGHPLYTFSGDTTRHQAGGEGIVSFGGTWHVRLASGGGHVSSVSSGSSSTLGGGSSGGW